MHARRTDAANASRKLTSAEDVKKTVLARVVMMVSWMYLTGYMKCSPRWKNVQKATDPTARALSASIDAMVTLCLVYEIS